MPRTTCASIIALALAVAMGCQPAEPQLMSAADPTIPVETVVAVSPGVIGASDTSVFTVTVRNTAAHPITIEFGSGCQIGYQVLDLSDDVVSPFGVLCTAAITYLTLEAGASETRTFEWTAHRPQSSDDTPLPPGEYRVVGGLGIGEWRPSPSVPIFVR